MITVSIVTYKTDTDELRKCLESLSSSEVKKIYVVDNSWQPYLEEFCKSQEKVEYIPSDNVGYGAAHNKAIKKAIEIGAKYHLVLNSDVYFSPEVLDKITAYMDDHEDVAQIQPYVTFPNDELQYTVRLLPTPANLIFRRFLPKEMGKKMDEC